MSDIRHLWMVVRADLHGIKTFVAGDFPSQADAQAKIDAIRSGWSSEHKQVFFIHDYTPTQLMQRLKELEINF